jgi:hypothetical protein
MSIDEAVSEAREIALKNEKTPEQILAIMSQVIRWQTIPYKATKTQRQLYWLTNRLCLISSTSPIPVLSQFTTAFLDNIKKPHCQASIGELTWEGLLLFCDRAEDHHTGDHPTDHSAELPGEFVAGLKHSTKKKIQNVRITW